VTIDTEQFRAELEQHRERLQNTIAHHDIGVASLTEETGETNADDHIADTASETYDRELDEGLEEDAQQQLYEVEAALKRLDEGTYGVCSVCGKEIPVERLEAVPWTTLCIDDARKLAR
jgi:RNA polymerase-binding protein DksA